jgi:hypothetical protein
MLLNQPEIQRIALTRKPSTMTWQQQTILGIFALTVLGWPTTNLTGLSALRAASRRDVLFRLSEHTVRTTMLREDAAPAPQGRCHFQGLHALVVPAHGLGSGPRHYADLDDGVYYNAARVEVAALAPGT